MLAASTDFVTRDLHHTGNARNRNRAASRAPRRNIYLFRAAPWRLVCFGTCILLAASYRLLREIWYLYEALATTVRFSMASPLSQFYDRPGADNATCTLFRNVRAELLPLPFFFPSCLLFVPVFLPYAT